MPGAGRAFAFLRAAFAPAAYPYRWAEEFSSGRTGPRRSRNRDDERISRSRTIHTLHFSYKNELIAPQPDAAAFQFGQCEAALPVKVENLFGRCELVRVTADPIHDVIPAAHAARVLRLDPRSQIFARVAVERGAQESLR